MDIRLSDRIQSTSPYAFAEVERQVSLLKEKGMHVIDFGVGDPQSHTPDFVIDELIGSARSHAGSGYPSYIGLPAFREACAAYMQTRFCVSLDPETEITSTIGSKEAVFHFPFGIINQGDIVICPTPGYPPYKTGTRFAGGVPYFVPLTYENNFLIDFDAIPQDIVQKAKIIWTNYPNSPTGAIASREWMEALIVWAKKHSIIIAADEGCYIDIYFDEKPSSILELEREGIITFFSLSKRDNMTGYRVGFCAGDRRLIAALRQVKTNIDSGTPNFVQQAAIIALNDTTVVNMMREEYSQKKEMLLPALEQFGLPPCESKSTFYLWQRAPASMDGLQLAKKFLELGIVVTPGAWISDTTSDGFNPGNDYVRFALVPTREDVALAVARLQDV